MTTTILSNIYYYAYTAFIKTTDFILLGLRDIGLYIHDKLEE